MAGLDPTANEECDGGLINSPDFGKRKDTSTSSYFIPELNISSKKAKENQQHSKQTGQYFHDEPSTSTGRKLCVNVSTRGGDKKTEIAVTSSYSSKKKVDNSTQSDRNIVGQEESPKERKKWVRPPVVGQASNFDLPPAGQQQTSSDSEIERKKAPKLQLSLGKSTSYFDKVSQKIIYTVEKDCLDGQKDVSSIPDNNECHRAPSPASASSLTSRPLEWDSGADVGYNNIFNLDSNEQRLSTIEKLALVQGTAIIFQRSDPEGTTGNASANPNIKIAPPVAESTPKIGDHAKSDSDSDIQGRSNNVKDRNAHHLFPEIMIKTIGIISPSAGSLSPEIPSRYEDMNIGGNEFNFVKKIGGSVEEVGLKENDGEQQSNDFPRSHSQNNIAEEVSSKVPSHRYDSAKSRSSSSVSTVVNKKNRHRNSIFKNGKLFDNNSNKDSDENCNDFINPPLERNRQIDNISRHTSPQGTDQFNTLESGPLTGEARVNSFEYLPGHIYENSVVKAGSDSSSHHSEDIWNTIGNHSTLKDDIERGANLMAEFIRSSKAGEDTALKKQLVRRVVEKLINSDYPDDDSVKSLRLSSGAAGNVMIETRGQISGESSTEKSDINQTQGILNKANKCVGTGISTSLSGYTETSEWNSVTESSKKYSSDAIDSNSSGSCRKNKSKLNKMTQASGKCDAASETSQHFDKKDLLNIKDGKTKRKGEAEMLFYLQKERKNQLHWIKSEIDHLSNLKTLLEKHEKLKKNLDQLKKSRQSIQQPVKAYSENIDGNRKPRFKRVQMESKSVPNYLKSRTEGQSVDSVSSSAKDIGWMSHHYDTEDERLRKENVNPTKSMSMRRPSKAISEPLPRATSYTITFPNKASSNINRKTYDDDIMLSVGELKTAIDEIVERHRKPNVNPNLHQPSLKDRLVTSRPDYVKKAESRREILSEIKQLRQERQDCKPLVIASAHDHVHIVPPPPLAVKRVFTQQNLRKQTERKYRQLAEVRNKKADLKRKEDYRTNRLMAEVFNKKLQRRTLQGQVNLSNSVCVTDPV